MFHARAPQILPILAASAVLHVIVSACSHGTDTVAMAGTGGAGGSTSTSTVSATGAGGTTGSTGSCTPCAPEKFTAIIEPCKPPDATHIAAYAEHEFPGVSANDLARVVAMSNSSPPLYFDFPGSTVILLVKDGAVGAICGNGQKSITFVAPMF